MQFWSDLERRFFMAGVFQVSPDYCQVVGGFLGENILENRIHRWHFGFFLNRLFRFGLVRRNDFGNGLGPDHQLGDSR